MLSLKRIEKLAKKLDSMGCDALLIEHPTNLLYLTGLELSAGKLLITSEQSYLIVDGRYIEQCRKSSPCRVYLNDQMPLKEWILSHAIHTLGFESDKTTYHAYTNFKKMADEIAQHRTSFNLKSIESPVMSMRLIKDEDEIEILREAARLGFQGYEFVTSQLSEGITELELAVELEYFWRKKGAKKVAFDPIIAFGANGSMPHYRAGTTTLKHGMSVLIDIGVTWKHYHSDMTRVVFFGEPPPQIKTIYQIVEDAKQQALELCKPGTLVGELDRMARQYITSRGYGEYFTHSLGHGLGLDVHETPTIRDPGAYSKMSLQAGMVITIEPGIYLPEIGGVRLEDTIVVTSTGYENLTVSI